MKTQLLIILTCILSSTGFGQVNVPLYSTEVFSDDIYTIDTSSWTLNTTETLTSTTGSVDGINGAAVQPCSGAIYVNYKVGATRYLGILDTVSNLITEVGAFGDNVASITFGADYDELYAVTGDGANTSETLYSVDITTGAMTFLATLGAGNDGEAISYSPLTGMIYHWSGWGYTNCIMEEINPSTLTITNIPLTGFAFDNAAGAVYKGNNEFIVGDVNNGTYFIINTSGVATGPFGPAHSPKGLFFPLRYIEATSTGLCPGESTDIAATTGDSYEWFLDGITTGITTPTLTGVITEGTYYCMITLDTCTYASNSVFIEELNAPNVNINPSPYDFLCSATDSVLFVGPMGGSAQWYLDGLLIAGETNDSLWVYSLGGVYNMMKTNSNGCSDSAAVGSTVIPPPSLEITTLAGTIICENNTLLITATEGSSSYNWYLDGVLVAGENNDSLYANEAGNYSVAAMFGACTDSSATGVVLTIDPCGVGLESNSPQTEVSIYPNPATTNVTISGIENGTVTIYAVSGEVVYGSNVNGTVTINTEDLTTGVYMIEVIENNIKANYKFIVK